MKKLFKKIALLVGITAIVISASSCGSNEPKHETSITEITVTATVNEEIPVIESEITGTFETTQPCL